MRLSPEVERGQLDAVAFPGKDSAQNAHSGHPGNVTDDAVDLDIHLREGLLHALHQAVAILAQSISQAQVAAHHAHLSSVRNEPRNIPKVWSSCNRWQSLTSVLRPGTFLAWLALTSNLKAFSLQDLK